MTFVGRNVGLKKMVSLIQLSLGITYMCLLGVTFCTGKQATTATFDGRSYISFSLQRSRIVSNNDEIVFEFRTNHPNGLILHVGQQYDYIYVAIVAGALEVAVNLGSGEYHTRVEPIGNKQDKYMDNQWYKVRISRDRNNVSKNHYHSGLIW